MPHRKARLTRTEQIEYRSAAQQLHAQGLIAKLPEWLESTPSVDIQINHMTSEVSELPSGQAYYAVWVHLVARQPGLILEDCRITTSWDDQIVLASDEAKSLCGPEGAVYMPHGVLNEALENALRFHRRGDLVRGTILAWGLRRIPDVYRTDSTVPLELTFTDSLGIPFAVQGAAHVTRCPESTKGMRRPKESLFDGICQPTIAEIARIAYLSALAEERSRASARKHDTNNESDRAARET